MKLKLCPILLLLFICAGCSSPDNVGTPASGQSPVSDLPPVVTISPSPEEIEPSPTPKAEPSQTPVPPPTPDSFDTAIQSVYPDAVRISGLIRLDSPVSYLEVNDKWEPVEENRITADFNGDNIEDVLEFTVKPLDMGEGFGNKPMCVTLNIGTAQFVFDSEWNDGIFMFIADFDRADKYIDIGIIETGTDIQCVLYVCRYDGTAIAEYLKLTYLFGKLLYCNGDGQIYYFSGEGSDDPMYLDTPECYDYRLKTVISPE